MNSQSHLEIDQAQALKQLALLGYKEGDRIFLRKFPPKGVKGEAKKFDRKYPDVPKLQALDGGLYFVVNGGGHSDSDVNQARAVFFEHDDRPIEDQLLLWQSAGLPEPTAQVGTRKSVHTYYVIADACSAEEWRELQQDLLEMVDGDRTLKNPSRVMRLAGAWHIKAGEEPVQCSLLHEGPQYSYAELRAAIPHRAQKPKKSVGQLVELKLKAFTEVGSTDLVEILNREILPRMQPTQLYNWPGHNWEEDRSGIKLRGACPWHDSQSGTAFHIEPNGANGEWLWHCPSCNIGGGAVEYRDRLRGGNGAPRGKDWVEIVQELANEAGVTLPEPPKSSKPKQRSSDEPVSGGGELVPLAKHYNRLKALLGDRLKLNSLTKDIELDSQPVNWEELEIELALKHNAQFKYFPQITAALAKEQKYSPVQDYLNAVSAKHGNDTSILEGLAERYFGRSEPIFQTFIQKWLISAVARAFEPGCKMDTALILQGIQGAGKSSFFKVLAGDWFDDSVGDVGDKDERLKLHRAWIVEWSELETIFRRKDLSSVKAFLSCSVDHVRPPYGRSVEAMKRQGVIVGTTNEDDFLHDPTGNRRFWIIPVSTAIDLELLRRERDRIWAAAVALYQAGESWWLSREQSVQAELINEQFKARDPWEDAIARWLQDAFLDTVTTSQILTSCLQVELARQCRRDQSRVAEILRGQGYELKFRVIDGARKRVWVRNRHVSHVNDEVNVTVNVTVENEAYQGFEVDSHVNHVNFEQKSEKTKLIEEPPGNSESEFIVSEVSPDFNVTNVTVGANGSTARNRAVTLPPESNVTERDGREVNVTIAPGQMVGRVGKKGWFGKVVTVNGSKASVHWAGDKYPSDVAIADLWIRSDE